MTVTSGNCTVLVRCTCSVIVTIIAVGGVSNSPRSTTPPKPPSPINGTRSSGFPDTYSVGVGQVNVVVVVVVRSVAVHAVTVRVQSVSRQIVVDDAGYFSTLQLTSQYDAVCRSRQVWSSGLLPGGRPVSVQPAPTQLPAGQKGPIQPQMMQLGPWPQKRHGKPQGCPWRQIGFGGPLWTLTALGYPGGGPGGGGGGEGPVDGGVG